VSKPTC